ncbi:ABC transporter substrate-binding protein [Mesotoga sp.]|uniref:ABC transporter substrate-binding protein n=1 Tax=Mesotoga sp. TaxID=2053577 RepID=UPI00345E6F7D
MVIVLTVSLFGIVELNTIFGPEDLTYYLKRNQEFYDLTGIRVNITVVPYGRDQNAKLMASMSSRGSQYDVFVVDCVEVPRYAEAGWLLDLTDIIPESVRNDIIPFARDGMSYEGRLYGLPWYSEWKSFAYNKAMLNKVGYSEFPKTWDEVIGAVAKVARSRDSEVCLSMVLGTKSV